ncbi:hypothetical protein [Streptomyces sp. SID11385]|uniref:hypothetical protein n=1 Tax=Streptomyces sp. SID11385 TaxID=2706031 RepID=UPI0013CB0326|nr:hypothetical protein [Streptomyces sp. SID11385]NEA37718.1 hypothetical protein [Streptomyces sp. SID11385]NEA43520.1 hypothetical protein [Streptomyces sp. SID11385]
MPTISPSPRATSGVRRRALLGAAVLAILLATTGLTAYLTRDGNESSAAKAVATPSSSSAPSSPSPSSPSQSAATPDGRGVPLPAPPDTRDPVGFAKAAAAALWSYDTRAYSHDELVEALHGWLTPEPKYADVASVDAVVPSAALWKELAANGQFATATVNEGHFPDAFSKALRENPGSITQAYVYAVTVSGKQSIAWKGAPAGGAESRAITLAVQCRPSRACVLAGVLPAVTP